MSVFLLSERSRTSDSSGPKRIDIKLPKLVKVFLRNLCYRGNFSEALNECSLTSTVLKNTIKVIGDHAHLRDVTGQSHPIYACTRANHARYSSAQVVVNGSIIY